MGGEFRSDLIARDVDGAFTLASTLRYWSALLSHLVTVPIDYRTDFASIPWIVQPIIPKFGGQDAGAVVHDYLYAMGGFYTFGEMEFLTIDRQTADGVLLEAMIAKGVGEWRRRWIYEGVRLGGGRPWARYRATLTITPSTPWTHVEQAITMTLPEREATA
jgi:hypothetical protein